MVRPSRPDLEVVGVFNPGVIRHDGETILLLRVAEAWRDIPPGEVAAPVFDAATGRLEIKRWSLESDHPDVSDSRAIVVGGRTWLTSISHLRLARSTDGIHFEVETAPALSSATEYETFGIEDPRITLLGDTYWINYSAVSPRGISTALASTKDFRTFERHGIIFPPDNRDVTIFPEVIDGNYVALHRPMPGYLGQAAIWFATSPDLLSWGNHSFVAGEREAVPFRVRTEDGDAWLAIYHGVTGTPPTYSLGALLLDGRDPSRVIARSREPILSPEAPYEQKGFFGNVVFTCGLLAEGDLVRIYYGAADGVIAVADLSLEEILAGMVNS